jgi:hypothetical protein
MGREWSFKFTAFNYKFLLVIANGNYFKDISQLIFSFLSNAFVLNYTRDTIYLSIIQI